LKTASSSEALEMVKSKKADAAVIPGSAAYDLGLKLIPIPLDIADEMYLSARVQSNSDKKTLGKEFVEFLFRGSNQKVLESYGFTSGLRPPPEMVLKRPQSETRLFIAAIGSLPKARISGVEGASLRKMLERDSGSVTFFSADGTSLKMSVAACRRADGIIAPMGDGNLQVIVPGHPKLRWLRRIEIG
jgi:hypothetical protein